MSHDVEFLALTNSLPLQLIPHPPRMSPTLQHGSAQELRLCHFRD